MCWQPSPMLRLRAPSLAAQKKQHLRFVSKGSHSWLSWRRCPIFHSFCKLLICPTKDEGSGASQEECWKQQSLEHIPFFLHVKQQCHETSSTSWFDSFGALNKQLWDLKRITRPLPLLLQAVRAPFWLMSWRLGRRCSSQGLMDTSVLEDCWACFKTPSEQGNFGLFIFPTRHALLSSFLFEDILNTMEQVHFWIFLDIL